MPNFAAPRVLNRPHSITADVEIPEGGAEGVLLSQGTAAGGYSFYVKDGTLRYVHNYVGRSFTVDSDDVVPAGRHALRFEFEPTGKPDLARAQAHRDGCSSTSTAPWSATPKPRSRRRSCSTPGRSPAAPTRAHRSPPTTKAPFTFTGTLHSVTLDVSGELITDPEAELRFHMARQ